MRADAEHNRRRLLDAAAQLVLETMGAPTMEAVAQRASLGVGTLYRHFPDREALLRALSLDAIDRTITLARECAAQEPGGMQALRRYLHGAIDNDIGVVNIIRPLLDDVSWPERTRAAREALQALADAVNRDTGGKREVLDVREITWAVIRFARPLGIGLDRDAEREIAHRQVDVFLAGLAGGSTTVDGRH